MKRQQLLRGASLSLFLVFLLLLLYVVFNHTEEKTTDLARVRPVRWRILSPAPSVWQRTFPGRVQAAERVDLSFRVSGPIEQFPVKEGEHVQKGDLLARLDTRDFETVLENIEGALSEAKAKLSAMRKGARAEDIRMLQSKVLSLKSQAKEAQSQFARFKSLYEAKAISKAEFDRYSTVKDMAEAALNGAVQELNKARRGARQEDITAMESRIKSLKAQRKSAQAALNDCQLLSPFDGIVARCFVENYQFVSAREPIVRLEGKNFIEIVVDLPESVLNLDPEKVEIKASFSVNPEVFYDIKLSEFASMPDRETQTYRATFLMKRPDDFRIVPGMTVDVTGAQIEAGRGDFRVPLQALMNKDGRSSIWVIDDDLKVQSIPVEVISISNNMAAISGDVLSGDKVVTAGVHYLKESQSVRLLEDDIDENS